MTTVWQRLQPDDTGCVDSSRGRYGVKLRESHVETLGQRTFDVLVIGGGINGAVTAAALTAQGVKVALVDRGDFAGFTSQESSNLVWGGIKYLESFEFALVRKLCRSRNRLLDAYPSSVREIRFLTSLDRGFRKGRLLLWIGTWLYWLIGGGVTRRPRLLSRADLAREEPALRVTGSQGGVEYSDAYLVDNDARFVFTFVRSAIDGGAIAANYVESLGAQHDGRLWTCHARDVMSGQRFSIRSRVLVNAAGPYVDAHNLTTGIETTHQHLFSRGIHLIVNRLTGSHRVLTFFADDGRLFFVIPMGPKSCIGTTDTREDTLPPVVRPEDRAFVLDNINRVLALDTPLQESDVIAERCGVRPLVVRRGADGASGHDADAEWTTLSRRHVIEVDAARAHISVFGGKLTDCLNVGEEVTREVRALGVEVPSFGRRWYGEPPDEVRDEFFRQARLMELDTLTSAESSEPLSTRLWRRYGESGLRLLEDIRADRTMAEVLIHGTEYTRGELHHAAERELITTLEDFLRRRSKIALIATTAAIRSAPGLFEACRILFGDDAEARFVEYFDQRPSSPS